LCNGTSQCSPQESGHAPSYIIRVTSIASGKANCTAHFFRIRPGTISGPVPELSSSLFNTSNARLTLVRDEKIICTCLENVYTAWSVLYLDTSNNSPVTLQRGGPIPSGGGREEQDKERLPAQKPRKRRGPCVGSQPGRLNCSVSKTSDNLHSQAYISVMPPPELKEPDRGKRKSIAIFAPFKQIDLLNGNRSIEPHN